MIAVLRQRRFLDRRGFDVPWFGSLSRFLCNAPIDEAGRDRGDCGIAVRHLYGKRRAKPGRFRDGFLKEKRFLIMDRDPLFTAKFRRVLTSSGVCAQMSVRP